MRAQSQRPYGRLFPGRRRPLTIGFDPRSLFRGGEQGFWYDPSDLSTLFQDWAGITPVTAVGQPVGLMLDKSKGLARGEERLGTGVPAMAGVSDLAEYNASTGAGTAYRSDQYNQSFVNIPGLSMTSWYFVDVTNTGANTLSVRADLASGAAFFSVPSGQRRAGFARNVTTVVITSDADVSGVAFTVNSVRSVAGNHQSISVPASRPILRQNATTGAYYLEIDGADDYMVSAPIDLTGTDEISIFSGARKISDAAVGMLFELSVSSSSNNSFYLIGSSPANVFQGRIAGSLQSTLNSAPYPAPYSAVLRLVGDISGDRTDVGVNGVVVTSGTDLGVGNFGLHSLYLFRRGGTTLPWAGHFYGLIGAGRLMTATETRNAERWLARKVGVALA